MPAAWASSKRRSWNGPRSGPRRDVSSPRPIPRSQQLSGPSSNRRTRTLRGASGNDAQALWRSHDGGGARSVSSVRVRCRVRGPLTGWRSGSVGCRGQDGGSTGERRRGGRPRAGAAVLLVVVEDGGDGAEGSVGDGMAVGPVLPGGERSDAHPVFADGRCHGVESVDRVAGPELLVGVALVGDGPVVAFDGGPRSLAGAGQVVLGSFELPLGDGEVVAGGASLAAWRCREATLGAGVGSSGVGGSSFGRAQRVAVVGGRCCDLGQRRVGGSRRRRPPRLVARPSGPRCLRRRGGLVGPRRGRPGTTPAPRSA